MTPARSTLLADYGRFYGEEHLAITFTAGINGPNAKRVTTKGWDQTRPLSDANFGASYVQGRGERANPAVVLRPSNLIVLECDSEADLVAVDQLDLPKTITVRSSADYKRHWWFRPPMELGQVPYVAFRFESGRLTADSGRYFLVPPSLHPSGVVYGFLPGLGPDEVDIAELPEVVYSKLAREAKQDDDDLRERISVDAEAKIQAGKRREMIFRYACMLRRWGQPYEEILRACEEFNRFRCLPPVESYFVKVQVDGAMKKAGDQEIADALIDDDDDSWTPIKLTTLPEHPPIEPTLGGVGLLYPGKRHVFSGPPESAKTLAAYCLMLNVIRQGGNAILIDFEMGGYDARTRLRELGATSEEIDGLWYLSPDERVNEERIARLLDLQPDLVVIDASAGAYALEGLDDNKRGDVERISSLYVTSFWRAEIATLIIDHVVKSEDGRGRFVIGSERKLGGTDVHLGFEIVKAVSRGESGNYKIINHKDRGGYLRRNHIADMELISDPETNIIVWTFYESPTELQRPTVLMERISTYLRDIHEAISRNSICRDVEGRKQHLLRAIDYLVAEKFVSESDTEGVRFLRHYSELDPVCNPENLVTLRTVLGGSQMVPGTALWQKSQVVPGGSERFPEPGAAGGSPPLTFGKGGTNLSAVADLPKNDREPLTPSDDDIPF